MFKNTAAISAVLVLFQVIGSSAKSLNFGVSSWEQNVEYRNGMNWTAYQELEKIYSFMEDLAEKYPKLTELMTIGKTYEGRDLKVLRVSENPDKNEKIWIDGGIHAREWVSPATVTFIMHDILSNWENNVHSNFTWYFMPVMNPDGYVYSHKKDRDWRKNRSPTANPDCPGVDLNRNFDIGWATIGSSSNPCAEDYHGPSAASELETQAVTKFLLKNRKNLISYLTYHSFSQLLIYPWSYTNELVKDAARLQRVGELAAELIQNETGHEYTVLPGKDYDLLAGGSDDWSRDALDTKYVYTMELRDNGEHGFELPPEQIIATGHEGLKLVQAVITAHLTDKN